MVRNTVGVDVGHAFHLHDRRLSDSQGARAVQIEVDRAVVEKRRRAARRHEPPGATAILSTAINQPFERDARDLGRVQVAVAVEIHDALRLTNWQRRDRRIAVGRFEGNGLIEDLIGQWRSAHALRDPELAVAPILVYEEREHAAAHRIWTRGVRGIGGKCRRGARRRPRHAAEDRGLPRCSELIAALEVVASESSFDGRCHEIHTLIAVDVYPAIRQDRLVSLAGLVRTIIVRSRAQPVRARLAGRAAFTTAGVERVHVARELIVQRAELDLRSCDALTAGRVVGVLPSESAAPETRVARCGPLQRRDFDVLGGCERNTKPHVSLPLRATAHDLVRRQIDLWVVAEPIDPAVAVDVDHHRLDGRPLRIREPKAPPQARATAVAGRSGRRLPRRKALVPVRSLPRQRTLTELRRTVREQHGWEVDLRRVDTPRALLDRCERTKRRPPRVAGLGLRVVRQRDQSRVIGRGRDHLGRRSTRARRERPDLDRVEPARPGADLGAGAEADLRADRHTCAGRHLREVEDRRREE